MRGSIHTICLLQHMQALLQAVEHGLQGGLRPQVHQPRSGQWLARAALQDISHKSRWLPSTPDACHIITAA